MVVVVSCGILVWVVVTTINHGGGGLLTRRVVRCFIDACMFVRGVATPCRSLWEEEKEEVYLQDCSTEHRTSVGTVDAVGPITVVGVVGEVIRAVMGVATAAAAAVAILARGRHGRHDTLREGVGSARSVGVGVAIHRHLGARHVLQEPVVIMVAQLPVASHVREMVAAKLVDECSVNNHMPT